jgi:hypothetical protein
MRIVFSKLGVSRMVIIALVAIIVVGGIVAAYIALKSSSPSPALSHAVSWQEMANYTMDYWNVTSTQPPYTVLLNDSMTVSSGDQWLTITARSTDNFAFIWSVIFMNQTYFQYSSTIPVKGGYQYDRGYSSFNDGIVYVVVNSTAITYTGITSHVSNVTFTGLAQIQTENGDGNFTGGELNIGVH